MPSELMDSSPSSFLSEEVQLPNERQIGFWKTDGMPDDYGPKDGKVYTVGDSSLPVEKHMSSDSHMLKNAYLNQDNNNNKAMEGGRTIGHSLRNDRGNRSLHVNMDHKSYLNVMGSDHYENGLFSSSLSELFTRKLRVSANNNNNNNNSIQYGHSVGASQYEEEEPFESLEEIEAQTIGNLLPDDDDLLSGVTDGLHKSDDVEDLDFFSSVGGMELGEDTQLPGEHPHGENPSRTLFVRNINSNVEDSELKILFEQYGDIRTLYTACKHRGFVMISYYDIRSARSAMQALQNKPLRRRKLDIHYSIPKENPSDKDVNQGTVVIFNPDSSVSNDELVHIFGVYGEVKEIREGSRQKSIEFYDIRAAEAALRELNKSDIGGKQMRLEPSRSAAASKRGPFPELDHDETNALLHMFSSSDFNAEISGPISHARGVAGSLDNGTLIGLHSATALDTEIQHGNSGFSSIIGVESGGGQLVNQLKYDFRSTPNYHPHSLPEYQDGLTNNTFLCNSPSSMAATLNCRMSERVGNRQFNRIGGSIGRSLELNDSVFGISGNVSCPPASHHYMWNPSHQAQAHNMMWPNSPSLMNVNVNVNGVGSAPTHSAPLVPRAPTHVPNSFLHMNNHHVGSAPSVNPSIWDRRHSSYVAAGESPDFHPGSLGNMRNPLDFNIFPRMGGDLPMPIQSKNIHHQNSVMFPSRGQMIPMMTSFDSPSDRARTRRNETSSNQPDNKKQFDLDLDRIMRGDDRRTTLMIKNIPNKYTSKMLLAAIDERHRGTYDFIYLPIDFKNKCNVGYAFINMTDPSLIIPFYQAFNGKKWEKFNSEKVASLAYARIQGKAALIAHFQNSSLMNEDKRCRPILFHTDGPNAGDQVPFPMGVNVRSRVSKNRNNTNEEQDAGGNGSLNGDSSSGGSTKDFE